MKDSVLILGAGPAGSSSAIQLLKSGHQVTILDRDKFPRSTPGETLHPGIEPLLKQLGVYDSIINNGLLRHLGITNTKDGTRIFQAYNDKDKWQGFQLFRKEFDSILINKAINLGAEFHSEKSPHKINVENEKISSIETRDEVYEADIFIDATGKRGWLARNFNISYTKYSAKRIAYYGYIENNSFRPKNPQLIWDQNGWTWISQIKENLTAWVRLDLFEHKKIERAWIPDLLADGEPTSQRKAVDVTWRKAQTCCKENCFLVGDATFVLDPGSSHGVLKAIMSGIMAAHLIDKLNNYPKSDIENHYNQWIDKQFSNDFNQLTKMYNDFNVMTSTKDF